MRAHLPVPQVTRLPERNLDVLRAVAVLSVLAQHVLLSQLGYRLVPAVWWLGRAGVLIFFVHTSLVLMRSLEKQGVRRDWILTFYVRRALRIYPLTFAAIALVLVLRVPPDSLTGFQVPSLSTITANLALAQNIFARDDILGPLWTLPLEVQMYAVLPLCYVIARRGLGPYALLFIGGIVGGVSFEACSQLSGVLRFHVFMFVPCFLAGVLSYVLLRRTTRLELPAWGWPLAIVMLMTLAWRWLGDDGRQWLFTLALGMSIPLFRDLQHSWLTSAAHTICTYSYGIYLLHVPALWLGFVAGQSLPVALQWLVFASCLIALPWAAHHLVEQPGIRLGGWTVGRTNNFPRTGLYGSLT